MLPALVGDTIAVTFFAIGGLWALLLGVAAVVVNAGNGSGQWFSAAPVALPPWRCSASDSSVTSRVPAPHHHKKRRSRLSPKPRFTVNCRVYRKRGPASAAPAARGRQRRPWLL